MAAKRFTKADLEKTLSRLSKNQTYFRTKPGGTPIQKVPGGAKYYPKGYFKIAGGSGGYRLVYVLPYTTEDRWAWRIIDAEPASRYGAGLWAKTPRDLAKLLEVYGSTGLKRLYVSHETRSVPVWKEAFRRGEI